MISISQLTKYYGLKPVLKGINMDLEKGKIYGIIGKNGAGKTTLFDCISGISSYKGSITSELDGVRSHTGYLQTVPYFMPFLTGKEYLQLLCQARGLTEVEFDRQNIFNLPLQQFATTYSTGMQKKLAFLGILLQQNEFFLLDEPFNGVDIQSNLLISEILKMLRDKGKTLLISSHIFSSISELADEILLLEEGIISRRISKESFNNLHEELKQELLTNQLSLLQI
ncbi:MAG: ATP-binding cassette domain-containing protein [Bacteroidota bacterium]